MYGASTASAKYPGPAEESPRSEVSVFASSGPSTAGVDDALGVLERHIDVLASALERLEIRIAPVLRPAGPATGSDNAKEIRGGRSAVAEALYAKSRPLAVLTERIESLTGRIDV